MSRYQCHMDLTVHWATENSYAVGENGRDILWAQLKKLISEDLAFSSGTYADWIQPFEVEHNPLTLRHVVDEIVKKLKLVTYQGAPLTLKFDDPADVPDDQRIMMTAPTPYFYGQRCYHIGFVYTPSNQVDGHLEVNTSIKGDDIKGHVAIMMAYHPL